MVAPSLPVPRFGASSITLDDVVARDFDRDGKSDLAVVGSDGRIRVFLNTSVGTTISFGSASPFPTEGFPRSLASGDFNRDGDLDLAVAGTFQDRVTIHSGDGSGSFAVATQIPVGLDPESVTGRLTGPPKTPLR